MSRAEPHEKMYYVYIIQCEDDSLYTSITNNLERRFLEHKSKIGGHYTASHKVGKIIYTEEYKTKSEALKREAQIKGWRREKKLALIKKIASIEAVVQQAHHRWFDAAHHKSRQAGER